MEQSIATTAVASADWVSISASGADFASDPEALLEKAVAEKRVWNLHAVVIVRYGRLVLERYFEGDDNARGRPLGKVVFSPMRRLRVDCGQWDYRKRKSQLPANSAGLVSLRHSFWRR
jgi:hypothetical protein